MLKAELGAQSPKKIKTYPPPPSTHAKCPEPLATFTASQISLLDPRGSRTRLFSKTNPDSARVGDILLVRFKSGDPFAGVCINIRRRGVDTSILLRAQLTRIGTELWVKVYSPTVVGIEVVQRAERRARRARLYYMRYANATVGYPADMIIRERSSKRQAANMMVSRKPKHDRGNLSGTVDAYMRTRNLLGRGSGGNSPGRGAIAGKKDGTKT
ncbi:hypothetical protein MMC26_006984 [Xylographa opegraphella]|nr:hypothetical protein [Xylographa opegraphella]